MKEQAEHFILITRILENTPFKNLQNEKELQVEVEEALKKLGLPVNREVHLNDKDIVDFMIGRIAIEAKIKSSPMIMYRQLQRYCLSDKFDVIILLTGRTMRLPRTIKDKQTHVIPLGKSWL